MVSYASIHLHTPMCMVIGVGTMVADACIWCYGVHMDMDRRRPQVLPINGVGVRTPDTPQTRALGIAPAPVRSSTFPVAVFSGSDFPTNTRARRRYP